MAGINRIMVGSQNGRNIDFLLCSCFGAAGHSPILLRLRKVSDKSLGLETITATQAIQETGGHLATTYVDLRSDTVTRPTPAMRRAMAEAEVGDDTYGEDPTVRLLEEETAALLGKEAALFVPSGCMGNQIAVAVHTKPGQGIVLDRLAHVAMVEAKAVTEFLGCRLMPVDAEHGILTAAHVQAAEGDIGLVEVENTHNWSSGAIYPLETLGAVASAAAARGLTVHMDGARLWNASAASGTPMDRYASHARSVMVCYSKGLGAPVGSA